MTTLKTKIDNQSTRVFMIGGFSLHDEDWMKEKTKKKSKNSKDNE
ncbi:hypothetical protein [Saccharicrinis aurantiacus]|nr:hypothetical protein [Saccharicrinis aurantiacus]